MNNGLAVSCLCFRYCLESKTQNYVRKMIIIYNYSILQSTWCTIFLTLSFLNSSTTLVKRACLNSQTYLTNLLYLQKLPWTQKKKGKYYSFGFFNPFWNPQQFFFSCLTIDIVNLKFYTPVTEVWLLMPSNDELIYSEQFSLWTLLKILNKICFHLY